VGEAVHPCEAAGQAAEIVLPPSGRAGLLKSGRRSDVPGQQLCDAIDRVVGNVGQHVAEIGLGIEIVQFS
jgi:hypothetical protein